MLVYLNPHTGKLLGQRLQARELAEKLRRLHVELFSPPIGKSLAALIGVALLLMIGVGVSLVRAQGQWRCNSWHARLGLLIAPVLVSIVASGLYSAYGSTDGAGISHRHALVTQSNSISLNSLNEMTNQLPIACAELPVSITASAKGLRLRCPDRLDFNLYPSAESETPVAVGDGGRLLWNLHSGEWAGLPGRGIWMWSVLAVLYLLYSGIRDWRHRKVKR